MNAEYQAQLLFTYISFMQNDQSGQRTSSIQVVLSAVWKMKTKNEAHYRCDKWQFDVCANHNTELHYRLDRSDR